MSKTPIFKVVDIFNSKTYQLCKTTNGYEYFCMDKLVLPPKELFVYIQDYFDENTYKILGFNYKYFEDGYFDVDKNKVIHIETSDGLNIINSDWSNFNMKMIASFSSLNDFWNYFTNDKNWYKKYLLKLNVGSWEHPFHKIITNSCNKLKKDTLNSEKEIELLYQCWEFKINRNYLNNYCPICKKEIRYNPRFPRTVCEECIEKVTDENNKPLTFGNFSDMYYEDGTRRKEYTCYINGIKCDVHYYHGKEVCVSDE